MLTLWNFGILSGGVAVLLPLWISIGKCIKISFRVRRAAFMNKRFIFRRVIIIVLDSVGIGGMPDAEDFGDAGSDTLGHVCAHRRLQIPHLAGLGLGNIRPLPSVPAAESPGGAFGKMAMASNGKDTTSGHWELAGIRLDKAFPTYPNGFPQEIIGAFEKAIGRRVLGNVPASGTEIIKALGAEHLQTGFPIVYTSADSVFQIAAHEEVVPVQELYKMCRSARSLLVGEHQVGRVIARPFAGPVGQFERTSRRQDYAIEPPYPTLLDLLREAGLECISVGKIAAIFCQRGITRSLKTTSNAEGMAGTIGVLREDFSGLLFTNLIDFDMLYGHRNDVDGYGRALEAFDSQLPELRAGLKPNDLCMLTADHGCDPSTPSTDHSREYVPILAFGPKVPGGVNLGTRDSLADLGQTVAENFGLTLDHGKSFLKEMQIT